MDRIETVWKMRECSMQDVKELAYDLDKDKFELMLQNVWAEKYNFLFITSK